MWSFHNVCCTKCKRCCWKIACRVGVSDGSTNGSAMANLCVTYVSRCMCKQGNVLLHDVGLFNIHVASKCANGNVIASVFHI